MLICDVIEIHIYIILGVRRRRKMLKEHPKSRSTSDADDFTIEGIIIFTKHVV